ncbi:MAG: primase C-terminal domain-containing protein, partial [Flavobacteriia bacterium]
RTQTENYIPSTDAAYIFKTCVKMVKKSKVGNYRKGNRNNYIFVLACLMCEFGVNNEQALHLIFERYNSLGFQEVRSTVNSSYRKNKSKFATKIINQRTNVNQVNLL